MPNRIDLMHVQDFHAWFCIASARIPLISEVDGQADCLPVILIGCGQKPTKRNWGITVNALEQVALCAKGSIKGVVSTYGDMLLFYVPSVGQTAKIKLLGWQAGLLKVKSL